jgi:glycine oxidase
VTVWDAIIIGGGIIGVSLALELDERGAKALVLDRGEPGQEASSAAGGMLAAADPDTPPSLRPLALESARIFPEYARKIETLSGTTVDFRRHGAIALDDFPSAPAAYTELGDSELHRLEPLLHRRNLSAFFVKEDSVDPRLLMRAVALAARNRGLEIRAHTTVTAVRPSGSQVEVVTNAGSIAGATAIDCRGAWSGPPVRPRKGQLLYVQPREPVLQHVVRTPEIYIVPRSSGKVLIGATVEDAGYDKTVEPGAIQGLLAAAARYLPELAASPIAESWAGLRPGTPDDLPILGASGGATGVRGMFVASGHFRNGILLAPITARVMADLVSGKAPAMDLAAFAPSRFAQDQPPEVTRL